MSLMVSNEAKPRHTFDPAEMGAIAHLYRGEVYRSTIWRTRLDNTTNWAIVTMGIALSTTFSSPEASPLPLVLVGLLIAVFLGMEARRYRYFNVWRARARWLERNFYAPIFTGEARDDSWQATRRRTDSRLDRSDDRLCLQFRLAGVRAQHDVARPTRAQGQGRRGGDGLVTAPAQRTVDAVSPRACLSVGGGRGERCDRRER